MSKEKENTNSKKNVVISHPIYNKTSSSCYIDVDEDILMNLVFDHLPYLGAVSRCNTNLLAKQKSSASLHYNL